MMCMISKVDQALREKKRKRKNGKEKMKGHVVYLPPISSHHWCELIVADKFNVFDRILQRKFTNM